MSRAALLAFALGALAPAAGCSAGEACGRPAASGVFTDLAGGCLVLIVVDAFEGVDRMCSISPWLEPARYHDFDFDIPDTVFVGMRYQADVSGQPLDLDRNRELAGRVDVEVTGASADGGAGGFNVHLVGTGAQEHGGGSLDLRGLCELVE